MNIRAKILVAVSVFLWTILSVPAFADDVTLTGTVSFGALDGSAEDHDGAVNGVFTVDDGDLVIEGTIQCNDDPPLSLNAGACPIKIQVSGDLIVEAGGGIFAENRRGSGKGGNISLTVGGDLILRGPSGALSGAVVSSGRTTDSAVAAGNITFTVQGNVELEAGSTVAASTPNGPSGTIGITADGTVTVAGLVASGPSRQVLGTKLTGKVLNGGSSNQAGGAIVIRSHSPAPAIRVEGAGIIVSQGESAGSQLVLLEGCGLEIRGLVASVLKSNGPSQVVLRSGESLLIDGRDLGVSGPSPGRLGRVRADGSEGGSAGYMVDLFTQGDIVVLGPNPASSLFAVSSSPGAQAQRSGGTITSISLAGTLTASGNAFEAGRSSSGNQGGTIDLKAKGDVTLDGATLKAVGGFASNAPARKGGKISARSFAGALSWTFGVGDVRPIGSGTPASTQGAITLTACTTVDTTGTQFPTVGSPLLPFPVENEGVCSPAAPSLPSGEPPLPSCIFNEAPVADDDAYSVDEGGTLNVAAPGVLDGDTDADGDPLTAVLVSGPAHASSFTLNPDGSFNYEHDGSETTSDSFTYKANDGTADSNVATVTITIDPANDAPVADDDAYNVNEGGTLNIAAPGVLDGDTDGDGDSLSAVLVSGPAHASSFALNADGSFSYTHDGSETTSDSFTYNANDGTADSNVATVTITIAPVNDVPVADDDAYNVNEGGTLNVAAPGVLDGDLDGDGDSLSAVLVSGPAHASSFALSANGSFSYTHDGSETLTDSFTYKANDGTTVSNVATVTITVNPVDDPPVAVDDSATVDEDSGANPIDVLANDTDNDGGPKTVQSVTQPLNGSVTITGGGTGLGYMPNANYCNNPPGTAPDTFTYTLSPGGSSATVSVLVNCLNDAPVFGDSTIDYTILGNTQLRVGEETPGVGVLHIRDNQDVLEKSSPSDPDGPGPIQVVPFSGNTGKGDLVLNADGTFTYEPNPGFEGTDVINFQVTDNGVPAATASGTITITVSQMVWYVRDVVDEDNPEAGDTGRSTNAFEVLADAGTAATPNDYIFVFEGNTGTTALDGGITLNKTGLKLHGEGVGLTVPGFGTLIPAGNRPRITKTTDAPAVEDHGVKVDATAGSLAGIEIRGLNISGLDNAIDVTATGANDVGVRISENAITAAALEGIDVNAGSTGTATIAIHDNTLTSNGTAIDIQRTAGTLIISALGNNVVSGNTNGAGIVVTGPATFDATPGGALDPVSGGTTVIGDAGNSIAGAGLTLGNVTGTLAFTDLDVFAGGSGVVIAGTGAFTGAAGTRITVPDGVSIIQAGNGPGVDVSNATIDLRLATLTVSASPTTGVSLVNVGDASVAPTNAFFSAGSGSSIANVTGTDFNVDGGNATISYAGSITNSAGRSVSVQNRTADSVTFASASTITDNGTGILVNANAAGSVTDFLGTLTMSTGANNAFTATSGGTLRVMGASNTIATTTGVALNVTSTTIGAGGTAPDTGLRFRSISAGTAASGPANGIVLNNTGTLGSLTVTGTGGAGTGGTIQRTTSHGVSLTSTLSPSFTSMSIQSTGGSGVKGTQVANFTFVNGSIDNSGTALGTNESNIAFNMQSAGTENNLAGTVTITGNTLTNAYYHGVDIFNFNGTIADATISNNTITSTTSTATSKGSGIRLVAFGSASTVGHVTRATINNNVISNFPSGAGIVAQGGNSTGAAGTFGVAGNAANIIAITNNRIAGNSPANRMAINAIQAIVNGTGQGNFNISGNGTVANPLTNITGNVIVNSAIGDVTVTSTIANNVIVANHTAGVGGALGISIGADSVLPACAGATCDAPDLTITVNGNNISQTDAQGILARSVNNVGAMDIAITGNTVAAPLSGFREGIQVHSGSSAGTGNTSVCLEITGNTTAGSGGADGIGLRKQGTNATVHSFAVDGMAATSSPGVETYVHGLNSSADGAVDADALGATLISATSGFTNCNFVP